MIDARQQLTVLKFVDGSGFTDLSLLAADYLQDPFLLELTSDDYLYLGYHKPFGATYVEIEEAAVDAPLTFEVYNGTAWVALNVRDETRGTARSGFWQWDKTLLNETAVDNKTLFFIRVQTPGVAVNLRGLNVILTSPARMKEEFFEIDNVNLLPPGQTSHIGAMVAATKQIIQELRNLGYQKQAAGKHVTIINQWDLIDIYEVREAATFLALAKVFFNLSSAPDDHWWQKYQTYTDRYKEMFRVAYLSLDKNDDGVDDDDEVQQPRKVFRWAR